MCTHVYARLVFCDRGSVTLADIHVSKIAVLIVVYMQAVLQRR